MDFDRDIHYSRSSPRRRRSRGGGYVFVWSLGVGGVWGGISITNSIASATLPGPVADWVSRGLFGALGVAVIAVIFRSRRAPVPLPTQVAPLPDDRFRVRCAASEPLEIGTAGFEPMFFYGFFSVRIPFRAMLAWMSVSLATLVAILFLTRLDIHQVGGPLSMFAACWASGGLVSAWLWPTYLRVSPGRLDILQYSAFKTAPVSTESHDLRSDRVLVDMQHWCVFLDSKERWTEIPFVAVPRRRDFAKAVLMGAVSTAPAAALPKDELVG